MAKVEALRERIADIHPGCDGRRGRGVRRRRQLARRCSARRADAVVDACDDGARQGGARRLGAARAARRWSASARPAASAQPQRVEVDDLADVTHDPMLAVAAPAPAQVPRRAARGRDRRRAACSRASRSPMPAGEAARRRRQPQLPRLRLERRGDRDLRHGRRGARARTVVRCRRDGRRGRPPPYNRGLGRVVSSVGRAADF